MCHWCNPKYYEENSSQFWGMGEDTRERKKELSKEQTLNWSKRSLWREDRHLAKMRWPGLGPNSILIAHINRNSILPIGSVIWLHLKELSALSYT